ncbi:MAG: site-specific integrase [Terriglobales bacterium]
MSHDRRKPIRYNTGMLCKEKRSIGMVWVFRWSEEVNGQRRQHKEVIGATKQFPTEAAANKEADRLRCRLNENKQYLSLKAMTFGELVNHYLNHELPRLSKSARKTNKSYIKNWIEAKWHGHRAGSMKTMQIQEWLDRIQRPDGTKLKIKNVLSAIFSHGVRGELVERNPVCGQGGSPGHRGASTGVRQSNRVSIRRVILAPDIVRQTLERLPLREATMALVDAVTGLRASELIALKWKHVGWETGILQSEFALVEGELKETKSRNNPLPLAEPVLQVLRLWREHTPYRSEEDWIFASPYYDGKTPYTYQILFRRQIRPVIEKVSGIKSSKEAPIGWHTLRRSLATLLISNGENVKVTQSQLRHTTPKITLELYAQAVSTDQQQAHKKVVRMVFPTGFPERLKARSTTATA